MIDAAIASAEPATSALTMKKSSGTTFSSSERIDLFTSAIACFLASIRSLRDEFGLSASAASASATASFSRLRRSSFTFRNSLMFSISDTALTRCSRVLRYSTTAEAFCSVGASMTSSPAIGCSRQPSTSTGVPGGAASTTMPASFRRVRALAQALPATITSPGRRVPRRTRTVAARPARFVDASRIQPSTWPFDSARTSRTSARVMIASSRSGTPCPVLPLTSIA